MVRGRSDRRPQHRLELLLPTASTVPPDAPSNPGPARDSEEAERRWQAILQHCATSGYPPPPPDARDALLAAWPEFGPGDTFAAVLVEASYVRELWRRVEHVARRSRDGDEIVMVAAMRLLELDVVSALAADAARRTPGQP